METIRNLYHKYEILCKSLILNILFFVGMELCFETILAVDNAIISSTIYGASGNDYNFRTDYMSFPYSYIVVLFLRLFPGLPWYAILDCVWLFMAFTTVTYLIYEKYNNRFGTILNVIMLTFFSYEGYICMQFTKTATFLIGAGIFALIYAKKRKQFILIGLLLVILGCFMRSNMMLMCIGAWGIVLCVQLIKGFWEKDKNTIQDILVSFAILLGMCGIYLGVTKVSSATRLASEEWMEYAEWTSNRAQLLDYERPSYEEYVDEYTQIGVSENDLAVWSAWNLDYSVMNIEVIEKILEIQPKTETGIIEKVFSIENMTKFLKEFPISFLTIDTFYALVLIVCLFVLGSKMARNNGMGILMLLGIYMLLNYYLFINGRYLQHQVDVGICFVIYLLLIYWMDREVEVDKKVMIQMMIVAICLLCVPYQTESDDKQMVSNERKSNNYAFYTLTNDDKEHYYTIARSKKSGYPNFVAFGVWDNIPIGFYKNIYTNELPTPELRSVQAEYGIENPYLDTVDNNQMYLVFDVKSEVEEIFETYIEEHTGKDVELVLVKEYLEKEIYRVESKSLKELYSFENAVENPDVMIGSCDVNVYKKKDKETKEKKYYLDLSGNMHLEGINGFAQNTYLKICDSETDMYELYHVKQSEEDGYSKTDENYYSKLSAKIQMPDFYDENDEIYLVIEYKGEIYQEKLSIGE